MKVAGFFMTLMSLSGSPAMANTPVDVPAQEEQASQESVTILTSVELFAQKVLAVGQECKAQVISDEKLKDEDHKDRRRVRDAARDALEAAESFHTVVFTAGDWQDARDELKDKVDRLKKRLRGVEIQDSTNEDCDTFVNTAKADTKFILNYTGA